MNARTQYKCPKCGAELTDHYGEDTDPWGWIEEDGERFRCEGHKSKEFYLLTDQNGKEIQCHWYTPSCGWFTLAEVKK